MGEPAPISLDTLTEQQQEALASARLVAKEAGWKLDEFSEWTLLRFLLKHRWKLSAAEKQIRSTAAWRAEVGADAIRASIAAGLQPRDWPAMDRICPHVLLAFTNLPTDDGDRLTYVDANDVFEVDAFLNCATAAEIFVINLYVLEHASYHNDRRSAATGRLCRWSTHFDARGIGMRHISVRVAWKFRPCLPLADNFYPSLFGFMLTVNAAKAMAVFWSLVSPFVGENAKQVAILDAESSPGALLSRAPASSVPTCYGGSLLRLPVDEVSRLPAPPERFDYGAAYPNELGRWLASGLPAAALPDPARLGEDEVGETDISR